VLLSGVVVGVVEVPVVFCAGVVCPEVLGVVLVELDVLLDCATAMLKANVSATVRMNKRVLIRIVCSLG